MSAYVPGLRVADAVALRRVRCLPLPGRVCVGRGQSVLPDDIVARAELPGAVELVAAAGLLGVEPGDLAAFVTRRPGTAVAAGDVLAQAPRSFGRARREVRSPVAGVLEHVSAATGHIALRCPPRAIELCAHLAGTVVQVLPGEGAVIEGRGALVQGVFGLGGERRGPLVHGGPPVAGGIWVVPGPAGPAELGRGAAAGVAAMVAASARDADIEGFLGPIRYAAALAGGEDVPFSLLLTDGFGRLAMNERAGRLLARLAGRDAALSGVTQLRAGVVRPEVFVPLDRPVPSLASRPQGLAVGREVRVVRDPAFGCFGRVAALPAHPQRIATGALVRVVRVRLAGGEVIDVPRANVELVEG